VEKLNLRTVLENNAFETAVVSEKLSKWAIRECVQKFIKVLCRSRHSSLRREKKLSSNVKNYYTDYCWARCILPNFGQIPSDDKTQ
jgi:hypothetical protein